MTLLNAAILNSMIVYRHTTGRDIGFSWQEGNLVSTQLVTQHTRLTSIRVDHANVLRTHLRRIPMQSTLS
jgi:hypothetical protein